MSKDTENYLIDMEDAQEVYADAILQSRAQLEQLGLTRSIRPKNSDGSYFDGHLPTDIHNASLSEISQVMTMMTIFADYVQGLAQEAKCERDAAEEKLKFIKAKIRKTKAGAKSDQDDATITDVRFVVANAEYITKLHSYEAISAREEAARRDIKTLSRLISTEQISNDTQKASFTASNVSKRWR
jgi:hypothetical protein